MIEIAGITIEVTRKKMKNMILRVCASTGAVKISAPLRSSDSAIRRFAEMHIDWIQKHALHYQENSLDDRCYIWGEVCELSLSKNALTQHYKKLLKEALESLIPHWENIIGQCAQQYQLRLMKSRWGSCCPDKRKICLNVSLIKYPKVCLEYVLVHELVHLLEASHNARFKALMDTFMPNWRAYKAILNDNLR